MMCPACQEMIGDNLLQCSRCGAHVGCFVLAEDGQHYGPYTFGWIRYYLSSGHLSATSLASISGCAWSPLESVLARCSVSRPMPASGSTPEDVSRTGLVNLIDVVSVGDVELAKALLARGADADAGDPNGWTPLHEASVGGDAQMARLLLASSADVEARDSTGRSPLHVAAAHGNSSTAEALIEAGADVNATDNRNRTPLSVARSEGHKGIARVLEACGATDPSTDSGQRIVRDRPAPTPEGGHDASVACPPRTRQSPEVTRRPRAPDALHKAAAGGGVREGKRLLAEGACVSAHDWDGCRCRICGNVRDEGHEWRDGACRECGRRSAASVARKARKKIRHIAQQWRASGDPQWVDHDAALVTSRQLTDASVSLLEETGQPLAADVASQLKPLGTLFLHHAMFRNRRGADETLDAWVKLLEATADALEAGETPPPAGAHPTPEAPVLRCSGCGRTYTVGVDAGISAHELRAAEVAAADPETRRDWALAEGLGGVRADSDFVMPLNCSRFPASLREDFARHTEHVAAEVLRGETRRWVCGSCDQPNVYRGSDLRQHPPE